MNKTEIDNALRKYSQERLSPTLTERKLVAKIYAAICYVLGDNCIQIGSYPRFTAITPLHDLDVLYKVGTWPGIIPDPGSLLRELARQLERELKNPTVYAVKLQLNTHSITISFLDNGEEILSVDVVPAYSHETNEFGQDTYMVPELVYQRHARRRDLYVMLSKTGASMQWIKSDPRGYIEVAKQINDKNADFRKSVKIAKGWKLWCKESDDSFKLKSFHLEQVITNHFLANPHLEISDALKLFFENLPQVIAQPQIRDRADQNRYIDSYLAELTLAEREAIIEARDEFLRRFAALESVSDLEQLFQNKPKSKEATYAPAVVTASRSGFTPHSPWAKDAV